MTKLRALLAGAALALAFACGFAVAQTALTSQTLTGNEVIVAAVGGPGGPSLFTPVSQLRNTAGPQLTALVSGALTIPVTTAVLISTAAVSGALAVTAPAVPWDGQIFEYINGSAGANTATMTFTAAAGQTVQGGAVATLAQNGSAEWRFIASTLTWYRAR